MKLLKLRLVLLAAIAAFAAAPVARAQMEPPVAVLSIAGVDELFGDVDYLTKVAGAEEFGNLLKIMASPYTAGIDKTKPWGVVVHAAGDEPEPLAFIPVKDMKLMFTALKDQIGEPKDAGGGVWEITDPAPMYLKEQAGFAFLSNESKHLKELPAKPEELLSGLNNEYDVALRVYGQNISQDKKDFAVAQMKAQAEKTLERQLRELGEDDPQYKLAKRLTKSQVGRLEDLINDVDEFTVGWSTDGMARQMHLDVALTAKAGSATAGRVDLLRNNKSQHRGFERVDASVSMRLTAAMEQDDIEQLTAMMDTIEKKALEEIEDDDDLPDDAAKAKAKSVISGLFEVMSETFENGKLDGGAAIAFKPKSMTFVAGGLISDGGKLEEAVRKLVDLAKDEPEFPGVKFDAEKHRGVAFHTMRVPIPEREDDTRKVFGDEMDVVLGVGKHSVYVSLGNEAGDMLKKVIDESKRADDGEADPFELNLALAPIVRFASSVEDNPVLELIAGSLEESGGTDHVELKGAAIENGVRYRLTIEEGVLKAIGQAAKLSGAGL